MPTTLAAFVNLHGIPRVSAWSLNRDSQCGGAFARTGVVSNTCSGVLQKPLQFTRVFGTLKGTKTAGEEPEATTSAQTQPVSGAADDPAKSPYPIWRPTAAYGSWLQGRLAGADLPGGWWNQGTPAGVSRPRTRRAGPGSRSARCPRTATRPKLVRSAKGNFPSWSPTAVYHQGDRVSFDRLPYQARWYTQGEQPLDELPRRSRARPGSRSSSTPVSRRGTESGSDGMMAFLRRREDEDTGVRRQWGADSHKDPMPAVPRIAGDWSMAFGRAAVVLTVAAWLALVVTVLNGQIIEGVSGHASLLETIGFLVAVSLLAASATAYLFGRLGFYYRARQHRRLPRAMLDEFFAHRRPTADRTRALLPGGAGSDPDDPALDRAAGVPGPARRPAHRRSAEAPLLRARDGCSTARWRCRPRSSGCSRSRAGASTWPSSASRQTLDLTRPTPVPTTCTTLAEEYEFAAGWIRSLGEKYQVSDHNERFFATHVLGKLAADLALTGAALRSAAADDPAKLSAGRACAQLYRRLAWTFRAELSSFQRKTYASLSAEPNKAMNLNSYIGLMGGSYREVQDPGRAAPPSGGGGGGRPGGAGLRLRAHPRRRQRDHARVLPAAGATCSSRKRTARSRWRSRPTARSRARPPASSGSPGRPPTCSTSSTRG